MLAMPFTGKTKGAVEGVEAPTPTPEPGQLVILVRACGVCRTDLHVQLSEGTRPFLRCQGKILLSMPIPECISNLPYGVVPRGRARVISHAPS